jgi:hypothetical protein
MYGMVRHCFATSLTSNRCRSQNNVYVAPKIKKARNIPGFVMNVRRD